MAEDLGVADVVRFITTQPDPLEWFRLLDVFVLPAREDPFPLVCLEAALVGVPIVAFDNGGMPDLLDQGCGVVVPYPDVPRFAGEVDALLLDGDRRRTLGARGEELIRSGFDVSQLAPKLWTDIERWIP
jgi:glycosyltransferase involved in cell wall biosynthesis